LPDLVGPSQIIRGIIEKARIFDVQVFAYSGLFFIHANSVYIEHKFFFITLYEKKKKFACYIIS